MKTKTLVILSMLLGIGTVLHLVMPGTWAIKPDMMLAMMFLGIALFPEKKNVLLLGIATGLLTALTTSFPMGQIPNIIDKPITAFVFYGLFLLLSKKLSKQLSLTILTVVCTVISGTLFLGSAYLLFELPGPFIILFGTGVLPAMALNAVILFILYPFVTAILKRTNFASTASM
ncbi:tryptophan transporter [Lederbergia galactosidilytica]|uniref:Tryptophan transporter n=1 Tax=Lederbergia galactosidilytica TaxID=217031 RepID=A0A177ZIJ6_9BACI|nr:tryptophan transporter [Lederbergia galactosidilytica]KRG16638.1 tryptophan transporter [Virgibacillus soli]OAK67777.1 tryptophan transporter [Lederbergia galactosidilytica]